MEQTALTKVIPDSPVGSMTETGKQDGSPCKTESAKAEHEITGIRTEALFADSFTDSENTDKKGVGGVFFYQIVLVLALLIGAFAVNIYNSGIAEWFVEKFRELTSADTEDMISRGAEYIKGLMNR